MSYSSIPLLFLLSLVEASVLPLFRVHGLQPNLVLVLLVCYLVVRGPQETFVLIPFAAFFTGLVDAAPMGTALLAFAPLIVFNELRGSHLREGGGFVFAIAFVLLGTICFHVVYLAVLALTGESGSWGAALSRVVLPTCVLNLAVLLPLYPLVVLFGRPERRLLYA